MFNKSYIKKAAAIAAVILAATALPVNMANADTQTTESTVTGSTVTGSTANQTASEYTEIRTASELVEAAKTATGNYKLMTDIDMTGVEWTPWDFSGTFDGNGHSILNLSVKTVSKHTMMTYDGNRKEYETYGAGFFGVLTGAKVTGLDIYGARIEITTTEPCFAAPIAGLADDSDISDCIIKDTYVSLTDSAKMWGTGGIAGFGSGNLDNITTDVTLVCVDTDAAVRDEQFMGGAYAAGFLNIRNCSITIDGYDSDHGYVHDGGLVGMYMVYPLELSKTYQGEVLNNKVKGMITFFEDNTDRRAYCQANMGEVMNWTYAYSGFTSDFKRNETYDYSVTLLPEMCSNPSYTDTVTEATAADFGYTTHTCSTCGYTYSDKYTIHEHNVGNRMLFMNDNKKYFADKICDIANLGVDIVGGCCGTTPEYIKKISDKLEVTREKVFYNSEDNISVKKKHIKNNAFYKDKTNGEKLIAVELAPPLGSDDNKLMEAAHSLKESGVDVLTFPDSPSGRTRADAVLMAEKVQRETGICVMPHLCCRDKNAIAIRSQLLGAHINNINNFLVITGDPIPSVMRQSIKSVFNFDSVGLMKIIRDMNEDQFSTSPLVYGDDRFHFLRGGFHDPVERYPRYGLYRNDTENDGAVRCQGGTSRRRSVPYLHRSKVSCTGLSD